MSQQDKLITLILSGRQDANIQFAELTSLLKHMGFTVRVKGSHHIYYKQGIEEILNIQPDGSKAKAYQIKQVRTLIIKYQLEV